jgi:hypothetical protein
MTYYGKFEDFPYIWTVTFNCILLLDLERSRQNETQSKVDHWDSTCPDRIVCDAVVLAIIYAFWRVWNDERLRLWDAYDELRVWYDAIRTVIHVADPIGVTDSHRIGHPVAGKAAYDQSLILPSYFPQSCSFEQDCLLYSSRSHTVGPDNL